MDTRTVINGVECKNYDEFQDLLKRLDQHYIQQSDYKSLPKSDDEYINAMNIFDNASEIERKYIFGLLLTYFSSALRQWKVDIDYLYTKEGQERFEALRKKYEPVLPYLGKPDSFNLGI